jgi:CheY-like chemotaxis protein
LSGNSQSFLNRSELETLSDAKRKAARPAVGELKALNVIYIDDDATNRSVLCDMIASAGLPITDAADAKTGLQAIRDGAFDLVLMDLRMPEMSGLTAIRQLRSDTGSSARHHVVVVTADITPGIRDLCQSASADDFLEKPVSMAKLFDMIAAVIVKKPHLRIN